jgi:putative aldouronate transport system permease protein
MSVTARATPLLVSPVRERMRIAFHRIRRHWQLYLVLLIPVAWTLIFRYWPMYGVQIAFRDYNPVAGFAGSEWVGLVHFQRFFNSYQFWELLRNTVGISVYSLAAGFPLPIVLAIAINEARRKWFKQTVQMVTYAPHFISTVVMVGIILQFLDPRLGLIAKFVTAAGGTPQNYMGQAGLFQSIYVWSGVWQGMGYASIIYIAALSSIDPQLEEAAVIDGASRLQKIWYIDLPGIAPTAIILLILNVGQIMNVGFEKIYLMQNPLNLTTSEVISTYVYKVGLLRAQYSFSAAVGFFNSLIDLVLLVVVNQIARRVGETSLW